MIKPNLPHLLLLVFLLLPSPALQAHLLKVFASAEGDRIQGSVYFAGGARASGAQIHVQTADGRVLARLTLDDQGAFSYQARVRADHVLVADSGDGHVARWTVRAAELPDGLPGPASDQARPQPLVPELTDRHPPPLVPELSQAHGDHDSDPDHEHDHDHAALPPPLMSELADARIPLDGSLVALVEEAVARQVRPLREQLLAHEERVRLRDILGGIGYILGLAGLVLWWHARRP